MTKASRSVFISNLCLEFREETSDESIGSDGVVIFVAICVAGAADMNMILSQKKNLSENNKKQFPVYISSSSILSLTSDKTIDWISISDDKKSKYSVIRIDGRLDETEEFSWVVDVSSKLIENQIIYRHIMTHDEERDLFAYSLLSVIANYQGESLTFL